MPGPRIARQYVRLFARCGIGRVVPGQVGISPHRGIAAMTIGAAEPDGGRDMHGRGFGGDVARLATLGLGQRLVDGLPFGRRGGDNQRVIAHHRPLPFAGDERRDGDQQPGTKDQRRAQHQGARGPHQYVNITLASTE